MPERRRGEPVSEDANRTGSQFRRGQTLSSYRAPQADESSRQHAHTLVAQRQKIGGVLLIVLAAVVFLALLLWQLIAQVYVTTSTQQLTKSFDSSLYEASVNEYLELNPAERLRFALNQDALSAYVAAQHPEVERLAVSGSAGLAQSNFTITFRVPVAGWQIAGTQYFVDDAGIVFERNYYEAPTVQIVDESGIRPEEGSVVVGDRMLGFLGRVIALAGERGYTVTQALLPQGATREVDVILKDTPTRVKFSIDRGAGEQVEDMDRALKYMRERGIGAEYVDVRVSGRAAYR